MLALRKKKQFRLRPNHGPHLLAWPIPQSWDRPFCLVHSIRLYQQHRCVVGKEAILGLKHLLKAPIPLHILQVILVLVHETHLCIQILGSNNKECWNCGSCPARIMRLGTFASRIPSLRQKHRSHSAKSVVLRKTSFVAHCC